MRPPQPPENTTPRQEHLHRDHNIYGVNLFLSGEHDPEDIEAYIYQQERTHIVEGLALTQRTVRKVPFRQGKTRGFADKLMVDTAQDGYRAAKKQYLKGDDAAEGLMQRRAHDITIAQNDDKLMQEGEIGDGFMVFTPYGEEWDTETAKRMGQWPDFRRGYIWLHRKISKDELECVDISVDRSGLSAWKAVLRSYGVEVPEAAESHNLPGFAVEFNALSDEQRDEIIDDALARYKELNTDPQAKQASNAFEATEFIERYGPEHLNLLTNVQKAIAQSLKKGNLHGLVRSSASRALKTLNCLAPDERTALHNLLAVERISHEHDFAFNTLVLAQRYGTWQAMSELVKRGELPKQEQRQTYSPMGNAIHTIAFLDDIYDHTNQAAYLAATMPGCPGGTSFLQQSETDIKSSIFGGESYRFDRKMYCVVCQAPPKDDEKPKMCGPCGICQSCDKKLSATVTAA